MKADKLLGFILVFIYSIHLPSLCKRYGNKKKKPSSFSQKRNRYRQIIFFIFCLFVLKEWDKFLLRAEKSKYRTFKHSRHQRHETKQFCLSFHGYRDTGMKDGGILGCVDVLQHGYSVEFQKG